VERVIGPDSTILIDYMLNRLGKIIKNLEVYPKQMDINLNKLKGLIFSQQVLIKLASLGISREISYEMVQRNALKVWKSGRAFKELLLEDEEIKKHLSEEDIEEIFNIDYHLKYVDELFGRVFASN
jgi:adenylosuccinate lyase